VAVDTMKTLKFYDFIDKLKKEEEELRLAEEEKMHQGLKQMFDKYDLDKSGKITMDEFFIFLVDYFKHHGLEWAISIDVFRETFVNWDTDGSGFISKYEMKPIVKLLFNEGFISHSKK
jgi:Ca2+-binding EF-hand superfamily protein